MKNTKISFKRKLQLFFSRHWLGIIGSLLFLGVWLVEKKVIEDSRSKIEDFNRQGNAIQIIQNNLRILEMEGNQTIQNKALYASEQDFETQFFNLVQTEIGEQIEVKLLIDVITDIDGDSVETIRNRNQKKREDLATILATKNYPTIYKYFNVQTASFSKEVAIGQVAIQNCFTTLNQRMNSKLKLYFWLYLTASLFVFGDQVWNTKERAT
jgi:hypothetical protein